jgi:hypothetical protein
VMSAILIWMPPGSRRCRHSATTWGWKSCGRNMWA